MSEREVLTKTVNLHLIYSKRMITNNKGVSLQKCAMQLGTYMGIYWIAKFFLIPLGFTYQFLFFLFAGLTIAVPFMGYYYVRIFRDKICGGKIKFLQAWAFMIFMYMFAALLTAVAHYVYFRYIDNGFILNSYVEILDNNLSNIPGLEGYFAQVKESVEYMRSMTPIELTMQLMSQNVFYCGILAFITALFVKRTTV
ncbi:hypothetical protein EZS27_028705 [termite gut metagenome]|uniref:DUF4199 domain-containing protein n=1 Tax=termite gut metagenome TaxID=433724 RepID=A0A5J4QL66_9ZZZZ